MNRFITFICLIWCVNFNLVFSEEVLPEPIVILVSLDGFRWDYPDRGFSPKLSEISQNGVKALSLKSQFPTMTFPNHYSIITGLVPEKHGILTNYFVNPNDKSVFSLRQPNVSEAKWYRGEAFWETARRNGIRTASYFWPGSEMDLEYRRPDFYEQYEHERPYEVRVKGVLNWLALPDSLRPKFITLYFDETDSKAHKFGTNSDELNQGITRVDKMVAMLDSGIVALGLADRVNLIVLSDHGMADLSSDRVIAVDELMMDLDSVESVVHSAMAFISPKKNQIKKVYEKLKLQEKGYKVYLKSEIPERYRYKHHPFISDIVMLAEVGWLINETRNWKSDYIAAHGYDDKVMDMHGIFLAKGPAFKRNYQTSSLNNTDIYPLLCKIFGIYPAGNIDGDILNIIHVLNE
jgi:ectonucleotide pyrophosphatase/phosphodiesterase family member 5